jgi:hypothetical protein
LNANRVVSVDRLADDLYSGAAPVTAVTQVQRQISEETELGPVSSALAERRAALDVPTRTAAFTTREPAHDAIRLATRARRRARTAGRTARSRRATAPAELTLRVHDASRR